jgi:hypothetical protein
MMTTDLPDLDTLDAAALRRELAERTGRDIDPTDSRDTDKLLTLCLEIAKRKNWQVLMHPVVDAHRNPIVLVQFNQWEGGLIDGGYLDYLIDGDQNMALALARLALAALRAEG